LQKFSKEEDIGESNDVADKNPEIVAQMADIMTNGRTDSDVFPLPGKNPKKS